ncbi:C1q-related factor-like [Mercenaria mercenaria]|uniref:C1q-related factor-like n=1 Tax=Mercenaria mercenaria TaxID=6596 RepID=UPI00234E462C|nr:C1q-related factor-like [Mercenaria mercenaria]
MLACTFVTFLWISVTSAVHAGETLSDEQLVASPFIRQLIERLSVLESRDWNQQQQIDKLEAEVDTQRKEILQLRTSVKNKDRQILELVSGFKNQDQGDEIPSDHSEKSTVIKRDSGDISRLRRENEVTVAFFSGLSTSVQHAGENQNVVFDNVETNLGNGYNSHHGVFTAPVAGVYVFSTSIMTNSGRKICEIVVNGVRKAQVYTHGDGHYDHGTQTLIVHLKKGDDVAIQIVEHNLDSTIHGEVPPYTTFSGFLLQQDFSDTDSVVG